MTLNVKRVATFLNIDTSIKTKTSLCVWRVGVMT